MSRGLTGATDSLIFLKIWRADLAGSKKNLGYTFFGESLKDSNSAA